MSQTVLSQTFLRYARAAGATERKHVTPHALRHVLASELLHAGANLRQIQELVGDKHVDSTQRRSRVTAAHELRRAVRRLRDGDASRSHATSNAGLAAADEEIVSSFGGPLAIRVYP